MSIKTSTMYQSVKDFATRNAYNMGIWALFTAFQQASEQRRGVKGDAQTLQRLDGLLVAPRVKEVSDGGRGQTCSPCPPPSTKFTISIKPPY